jgi:hypothetical protein
MNRTLHLLALLGALAGSYAGGAAFEPPTVGEPSAESLPGGVRATHDDGRNARIQLPIKAGKYRLFVCVHDGRGNATTAIRFALDRPDRYSAMPILVNFPQRLWARQLNTEGTSTPNLVENHGGLMWILGMKTDGGVTTIKTVGGVTELLGALAYSSQGVATNVPLFINDGGHLSCNCWNPSKP